MSSPNRVSSLLALARETSSDKRRQLLREITDVFMEDPDAHSKGENEQFGDVMARLVHDVEMEVRRDLANRLATIPNAPHALITQLADDQIEVAQPVLMNSPVLKDHDLVALAESKGQDHLKALSQRKILSTHVTDAIVRRGDDGVLETLVSNQGAQLSRNAMETVVSRAEKNERLHAPVLNRQDLPPDLMHEMFFFVNSSLREFILERTSEIDPKILDELLKSAERRTTKKLNLATGNSAAEAYINDKETKRELNEKLLEQLLRENRPEEFTIAFARLTGIGIDTARRILDDPSREGVAIACRAARFDRATFSAIVLLWGGRNARPTREAQFMLSLYDRVTVETAQRVIRFWRIRRQAAA